MDDIMCFTLNIDEHLKFLIKCDVYSYGNQTVL